MHQGLRSKDEIEMPITTFFSPNSQPQFGVRSTVMRECTLLADECKKDNNSSNSQCNHSSITATFHWPSNGGMKTCKDEEYLHGNGPVTATKVLTRPFLGGDEAWAGLSKVGEGRVR